MSRNRLQLCCVLELKDVGPLFFVVWAAPRREGRLRKPGDVSLRGLLLHINAAASILS